MKTKQELNQELIEAIKAESLNTIITALEDLEKGTAEDLKTAGKETQETLARGMAKLSVGMAEGKVDYKRLFWEACKVINAAYWKETSFLEDIVKIGKLKNTLNSK